MNNPKKTQIEKQATIILLVVLAVSMLYTKKRMDSGPSHGRSSEEPAVINMEDASKKIEEAVNYKAGFLEKYRDPLKKPYEISSAEEMGGPGMLTIKGKPEAGGEALTLQGILWGGRQNMAIVSGQVVTEGDTVNQAKVVSITRERVVLTRDNSDIELAREQ